MKLKARGKLFYFMASRVLSSVLQTSRRRGLDRLGSEFSEVCSRQFHEPIHHSWQAAIPLTEARSSSNGGNEAPKVEPKVRQSPISSRESLFPLSSCSIKFPADQVASSSLNSTRNQASSGWVLAAGLSVAAAAALGGVTASAKERLESKAPADVVLYQYDSCPFCNKIKGTGT